jgi:hypothetical protein
VLFYKYYWGDHIKEGEMGKAYSAHGGWKLHTKFWLESLMGRDNSEDVDVGGSFY